MDLQCNATIGKEATDWGFRAVQCGQTVATRGYWARTEPWENTDHFVAYCPIEGHEADVRRRYPAIDPPEPAWLHEMPEFADDVTVAKWFADREETWTAP